MQILFKLWIKDYQNIKDVKVKSMYGKITSIVGVFLNIFLFIIKYAVGVLFQSVSIQADAFNNLSDAGSSLIALVSFIFSSRPADEDHPFGHERFEYICSLFVSFLILFFSYELIVSSIVQIMNPSPMTFDFVMILVLIISIIVKLYMFYYNTKYGRLIQSTVMKATALDSISDVLATSGVVIALIISFVTGINLDGYMGVIVALLIGKAGIGIIKDTLDALLGQAPDPKFTKDILSKVLSYEPILGVHDLVVHSYGTNKTFVTLHAEVSAKADILESHDIIDVIEKDFKQNEKIDLVIHMDPIEVDDPFTNDLRRKVAVMISGIDESLSFHDFRIVKGKTHHNLIFDVVVPFHFRLSNQELIQMITERLPQNDNGIKNEAVVTLDTAYTSMILSKEEE